MCTVMPAHTGRDTVSQNAMHLNLIIRLDFFLDWLFDQTANI